MPKNREEIDKNFMKRIKANDPAASSEMGRKQCREGDYEGAFQYWTKAAELGDLDAHYQLSCLYRDGKGVEKNEKKEVYHLEEAAIGGDPEARYNLGCHEGNRGRVDRAVKHFIISAIQGHDNALEAVKKDFTMGFVRKEDLEAALRGHQAAVDATKSQQREEAYGYLEFVRDQEGRAKGGGKN
jgi:tetratricopeptide (TPR) repeat protein